MRVQLNKDKKIGGKQYTAGATVIVKKEDGMRMISEGTANMIVEVPENRVIGLPENRTVFSNHTRFGRNDV